MIQVEIEKYTRQVEDTNCIKAHAKLTQLRNVEINQNCNCKDCTDINKAIRTIIEKIVNRENNFLQNNS